MSRLLPYETILKARDGDPEAVNAVLLHYAGYIRYFSKVNGQVNAEVEDYVGSKLAVDISGVLSAQDSDKLLRALNRIDEVCLPPHLLQQYGKIRHESKDAAVPDGTF